jgi:DNA helicase-2/ATP-dependent DNA helicase PcrA
VGDEDQSIYSWRGANIENILSFETDYPEAQVIKLEENYRSTQTIVKAASEVIRNNNIRKEKTLHTNNKEGDKIIAREVMSEYDEGKFVARNIQDIMKDHSVSYDDIAIFYRTNSQSRAIEEELRSYRIPYQIIGGVKFYDRMEVKDLICYLRLIMNENDDASFMRVLNIPTRGIGKVTADKIINFAHSQNTSLMKAAQEMCDHNALNAGTTKKLMGFVNAVRYLRVQSQEQRPSEFIKFMIDHLQFVEYLKFEKPEDHPQRVENINELINVMTKFERERGQEATLSQFLEEVALVSDIDELDAAQHSVKLMTLHVSKGLEYPYVFIVGFEDGIFPSNQSIENMNPEQLEEERRLCYVGMTRAKEKLFLSYAQNRMQWGQELKNLPSRFLKEIPSQYLDNQSTIARPKTFHTKEIYNFEKTSLDDPFPDYEQTFQKSDSTGFAKGMKVRHPAFGVGIIDQLEGNGEDQKITIRFKNLPLKKFILKYARLERV